MWCVVVRVVDAGKPAPTPAGISVHTGKGSGQTAWTGGGQSPWA